MNPGQILVANRQGVYVIKLVGDVRLTFCISFDQFIDAMLADTELTSVLFDLSDAEAVDSTTLGLMAKISLLSQDQRNITPVILATNSSIKRILNSMGFADIFSIVDKLDSSLIPSKSLCCDDQNAPMIKERVIEAHKILMSLNEQNADTFKNLVKMLEEG
ncbi:MAG: STAS domain-containing protein [Cellvibrio sp.]|nr:STAS domain-containing protein [Cellvibrio sp.]